MCSFGHGDYLEIPKGRLQPMTDNSSPSSPWEQSLALLVQAGKLKNTPRTGWAVRGIPSFESVADHTCGVAMCALVLLDLLQLEGQENLDREKVLAMAITHDLPECVTGDLSLGASRLLPDGVKAVMEDNALQELLQHVPFGRRWHDLAQEFEDNLSAEAKLVKDCDRLDLLLQALAYERAHGTVELGEFWTFAPEKSFHYDVSRQMIARLQEMRPGQ
jgi:putative hydrolases of HD superfamily